MQGLVLLLLVVLPLSTGRPLFPEPGQHGHQKPGSGKLSFLAKQSVKDSSPCFQPAAYLSSYNPLMDTQVQQALAAWDAAIAATAQTVYGSFSVGVVYGQQLIWSKGYNLVNMTDPASGTPTVDTPYRVGSVSKMFTALMMLQMRDAGVLHTDEPLTNFIPSFSIQNPYNDGPGPRLDLLASHMAGLPREMPCDLMYTSGCTESVDVLLARIANLSLIGPPGLIPSYSNLGFALLGRGMAKRTESGSWEDYVTKNIAAPLGLNNTGNDLVGIASKIAVGYSPTHKPRALVDLGYASPAGQMYSSVADLARVMALVFSGTPAPGIVSSPVLQPQTVREWLHPAYVNADQSGFGKPWEMQQALNYTLYGKGGDINGYNALFLTVPDLKLGFIGLEADDDGTALAVATNLFTTSILAAFDSALRALSKPPTQPPQQSDYVGSFSFEYGDMGLLTINISVVVMKQYPVLFAESSSSIVAGVFEYKGNDGFLETLWDVPAPCMAEEIGHLQYVYFQRSATGAVTSLTVPGLCWNCVFTKSP